MTVQIPFDAGVRTLNRSETESLFTLRPDNLVELVLFTRALRHIRKHFDRAEITICVKQNAKDLLADCPYVERIVFWDNTGIREFSGFLTRLFVDRSGRGFSPAGNVVSRMHR